LQVTVGANVYTLTGFTVDVSNTSTAPQGISGTLTFSSNVSVPDGTAGIAVVSAVAPTILRPSARATTAALTGGDTLTMEIIMDAVARLRSNGVEPRNGLFDCLADDFTMRQLFADPEFQLLFRGTGLTTDTYRKMRVVEILDVRFIRTNEAPQQTNGTVKIHRPIVCGESCLIEGQFAGLTDSAQKMGMGIVDVVDGVAQVTRPPLDRLDQIVAQSWYAIMGYAVPTDVTANPTIIPTANNSYFKRAVIIETGGA
jgi:hypothetical protein